jgi:hypothetical protein
MTATQILNLTQHAPSAEQREAGVIDLPAFHCGEAFDTDNRRALADAEGLDLTLTAPAVLKVLLNFEEIPTVGQVHRRATLIAALADEAAARTGATAAMIGGFLPLMEPLSAALRARSVAPLFSFTRRETVEETLPDGAVKKTAVFRHVGFVPTR